jgi:hypothetical protein
MQFTPLLFELRAQFAVSNDHNHDIRTLIDHMAGRPQQCGVILVTDHRGNVAD